MDNSDLVLNTLLHTLNDLTRQVAERELQMAVNENDMHRLVAAQPDKRLSSGRLPKRGQRGRRICHHCGRPGHALHKCYSLNRTANCVRKVVPFRAFAH